MPKKLNNNAVQSDLRSSALILPFADIRIADVALVGGKNASLGEMYQAFQKEEINVPNGFAVTAFAYRQFLIANNLETLIKETLLDLDIEDVVALQKAGKKLRKALKKAIMPKELTQAIDAAYERLAKSEKKTRLAVAVRSSATAEDLPDASFAGQQETYLNIVGKKALRKAVQDCMASLFTDRAISYRQKRGYDHLSVSLSVTVQTMVNASNGASGVLFTLDTESGFDGVSLITSSYGLGEFVVKGEVIPDRFYVFKEGLKQGKNAIISHQLGTKEQKLIYNKTKGTVKKKVLKKEQAQYSIPDKDIVTLAQWGSKIEVLYGKAQDIEWAKDGKTGKLYILQARPETVTAKQGAVIQKYHLKQEGNLLLEGIAVGQRIGAGKVRIVESPKDMAQFKAGEVLVTRITDPDWEPIMRKAAAIVTEQGGKTSHAAIVSRELGVPCVVGAIDARSVLKEGNMVTVSCAQGETGKIFDGSLPFEIREHYLDKIPSCKTKIMMNIGDPSHAFSLANLPNDGVGLARLEFIFTNFLRIHPLALLHFNKLKDKQAKKQIAEMTKAYKKKSEYCIAKLAEGISMIAAASYPKPVIVRMSDFKTNEYATLIGGKEFEPKEENPMIGWRGASRYYSKEYKAAFGLECAAVKKAREEFGLTNIIPMIPFCRTPEEAQKVLDTMKDFGLERGKDDLQVYVMCEIPSNVVLAEEFAALFDGVSIGSNDLTQLTLGLDRDSSNLTDVANVKHRAVVKMIKEVIRVVHKHKKKIGICGQAPSDYPEFASMLVEEGIDSISLNPDTIVETRQYIADAEAKTGKRGGKTNGLFLGIISFFALLSSLMIGMGAGCIPVHDSEEVALLNYETQPWVMPTAFHEQGNATLQDIEPMSATLVSTGEEVFLEEASVQKENKEEKIQETIAQTIEEAFLFSDAQGSRENVAFSQEQFPHFQMLAPEDWNFFQQGSQFGWESSRQDEQLLFRKVLDIQNEALYTESPSSSLWGDLKYILAYYDASQIDAVPIEDRLALDQAPHIHIRFFGAKYSYRVSSDLYRYYFFPLDYGKGWVMIQAPRDNMGVFAALETLVFE